MVCKKKQIDVHGRRQLTLLELFYVRGFPSKKIEYLTLLNFHSI